MTEEEKIFMKIGRECCHDSCLVAAKVFLWLPNKVEKLSGIYELHERGISVSSGRDLNFVRIKGKEYSVKVLEKVWTLKQ